MFENIDRRALAAATILTLATWACSDGGADERGAEPADLRVVARETAAGEYAYELPDRVPAGATRISLTNDGDEEHHAQLFKLNDDATVAELATALATGDPAAALAFGTFEGGTGLVAADSESQADAVADLTPGTYVFICFVEDKEGAPHLAHGMLEPFEVTGTDESSPVPEADVEVELVDYGIDLPESIAGDALLEVTNAADLEPHEMIVARLDDGAAAEDVLDALDAGTSPPATSVGGVQAILPGATQSLQLDLEPGRYVVICHIPSPFDQTPHYDKGMIREVTVT
jgi:hypothetical protein